VFVLTSRTTTETVNSNIPNTENTIPPTHSPTNELLKYSKGENEIAENVRHETVQHKTNPNYSQLFIFTNRTIAMMRATIKIKGKMVQTEWTIYVMITIRAFGTL
jgi:hypothetical protein